MMAGKGDKKQLGKILLRQKLVTPQELQDLLDEQRKRPGARLGSTAIERGQVEEVDMLRALSEQHGLPGIDLAQTVVPLENLKLIPHDIAKQNLLFPFSIKEGKIFLAMADPSNDRVVGEIEFVTGKTVVPYVAVSNSLERIIDEAYEQLAQKEEYYIGAQAPSDYLQEIGLAAGAPSSDADESPAAASSAKEPVARRAPRHPPTLDPAFGSRVAPLPTAPPSEAPRSRGGKLVLIVDDEEDIRRMLRRVLLERDITVIEASRGSQALSMVREHEPDAILLDAMLPEVHGFDICRRIKGSKKYGGIPIIMVSAVYRGWRFAEDLKTSYGVSDFLEKPFKISDVIAALERALEGREEVQEESLSNEASELLQQGIESYRAGDLDTAIAYIEQGVGLDPLAFRLHYHLGLLYGRRDQIFEGIRSLETSVELAPRNFSALKNLAVLYQRAGFKLKSVEMWERALGAAPDEETRQGIKEHLMSLL